MQEPKIQSKKEEFHILICHFEFLFLTFDF